MNFRIGLLSVLFLLIVSTTSPLFVSADSDSQSIVRQRASSHAFFWDGSGWAAAPPGGKFPVTFVRGRYIDHCHAQPLRRLPTFTNLIGGAFGLYIRVSHVC